MPDCQLCGRSDLPDVSSCSKRKTRKDVSVPEKTQWIDCDQCKKWMHPYCCGLTLDEFQTIKASKSFYKCICCCLSKLEINFDFRALVKERVSLLEVKGAKESSPPSTKDIEKKTKTSNTSPPAATEVGLEPVVDKESEVSEEIIQLVNQGEKEAREKIIIVDEIPKASEYRDSRVILKEIKKASEIDVEFAYRLAKGGVAIHTASIEERNQLH